MSTVIRLRDYSYSYSGADHFVLKNVNLEIEVGQCCCLTGPTGSGKTTLALALKGLLPPGRHEGELTYHCSSSGESAGIGVVLQNPETQLLASTVGAEAAFGLENLCVDPALMPAIVENALYRVGLAIPLDSNTGKLSMGQKYRLIMASHLVMSPRLLVLDEPAAQLDPAGLAKLAEIIRRLKGAGISFLLCENQPELLREEIDLYRHLARDGTLQEGRSPFLASSSQWPPRMACPPHPHPADEMVGARNLAVESGTGKIVWSGASFSVTRGCRVVVEGVNGAGKTTLLRCLMGFVQPSEGTVCISGKKPIPGNFRGKVGCLLQNPQKQLFENTVFEEVAFPLKRLGQGGKELEAKVREILALCGIEDLAERSPHKLSYGQKHIVALASVLAPGPELLLLDDPFAGLDRNWCEKILDVLSFLNEKRNTTLLLTSHHPGGLSQWADMTLEVEEGKIVVH